MGGSGPSRAIKFLYAPAPPTPHSMGSETFLKALVHKTTYAPMIYTALCIMFWMRCISITWASGRGLGPGNLELLGPQMALIYLLCHITGSKILSIYRANPLSLALVMDMHASKTLCTRLYKSLVHT
jgi:hypothetical protein